MSEHNGKLPHGWISARLGDILEFKYGKSLPANLRDGSRYPVFGSNGIVGHHSKAFVLGPALVVGRKGSIGEVHQSDGPCSPIDTTYFVDDFYSQPIRFWYYRLKALPFAELDRATALPGLNRQDAYDLEITLPPLPEQQRIVAKIEALQERSRRAREALAEVGLLLEQFRQSVLAAAFRGDLTANWRAAHPDVEPASELLQRIRIERRRLWEQAELAKYEAKGQKPPKNWQERYEEPEPVDDSELPELPEGWLWSTLETISLIQGGVTLGEKKRPGSQYISVPYLRVANVQRGYLDLTEIKMIEVPVDRLEQLRLQDGDLLFNEGGDRDKLGRGWIWKAEIENCIHQNHVFRARLYFREMLPELISHYANEFGRGFFFSHASQTVNLASINKTQLSQLPVPIIPLKEQEALAEILNEALKLTNRIQARCNTIVSDLEVLDQAILTKAFRGALVPQDPNDEPASVFLNRIRERRAHQTKTKTRETSKT